MSCCSSFFRGRGEGEGVDMQWDIQSGVQGELLFLFLWGEGEGVDMQWDIQSGVQGELLFLFLYGGGEGAGGWWICSGIFSQECKVSCCSSFFRGRGEGEGVDMQWDIQSGVQGELLFLCL